MLWMRSLNTWSSSTERLNIECVTESDYSEARRFVFEPLLKGVSFFKAARVVTKSCPESKTNLPYANSS